MPLSTPGMHHVTAICGDPQENYDFYTGPLGLRLLKKTVNFDMPETYHLYYGDGVGRPGTILTYFPWGKERRGQVGAGQVTAFSLAIPEGAIGFWIERLKDHDVEVKGPITRFQEEVIQFQDPDGIQLELVSGPATDPEFAWSEGPVPAEHAIRGVHSLLLHSRTPDGTAGLLVNELGFEEVGEEGNRWRFEAASGAPGSVVDIVASNDGALVGKEGSGTIHHVAWRTKDDDEQIAWRERLRSLGFNVTDVRDRQYFHSIYFVEHGGILFEIATDSPGFLIDESEAELGTALKLPPWYEARRDEIESALLPLKS